MSEAEQPSRGGSRKGAGRHRAWKTDGKTKLIRVPEAIADEVLEAARAIDTGKRLVLLARRRKPKLDSPPTPTTSTRKRADDSSAAPRQKASGWVEKYSATGDSRKKNFYYRYSWNEGQKQRRCHIPGGNADSKAAQSNLQKVISAIAENKSPLEINEMIKSWKSCRSADQPVSTFK